MDTTAKEQVLSEIAALEEQVRLFTAELDVITSTDPFNPVQYNAIKGELDTANGKLEAKRAELANIEDAEVVALEELSAQLESINIGGETVSLRALVPDEAAHQLLNIWLKQREMAKAQVMAALKSSYESQIEELESGMDEISTLRQENYRLSDKCADLEAKRDAAAAQIDELQGEITRLKADNDNLRKQIEDSTKPKETTADAAAALERWKNSRPAITDLRWKDERVRTVYVATLVETGEPIEFGYLEKGKYREVTQAEADSFRAEQAAQPVEEAVEENIQDTTLGGSTLEPPVIEFPTTVPGEFQGTSANNTVVLTAEETTRRILAIEKRLDELEGIESVA